MARIRLACELNPQQSIQKWTLLCWVEEHYCYLRSSIHSPLLSPLITTAKWDQPTAKNEVQGETETKPNVALPHPSGTGLEPHFPHLGSTQLQLGRAQIDSLRPRPRFLTVSLLSPKKTLPLSSKSSEFRRILTTLGASRTTWSSNAGTRPRRSEVETPIVGAVTLLGTSSFGSSWVVPVVSVMIMITLCLTLR